ncbi:unnamed protein product (macronuclear) [Paramecium tetraurelia]|uniref:Trafficking protein particle complex subunit n=1 Tax=Paramecium tetraurelia TaxID=5888 RepID=A0BNQ9_PARTE|nr:uncharacterized protein GSPATT00030815001 [Paramecium tetraurelia]CAK60176.1 unnamed protein product [Paramecium tetraurelia]|eukprot:XP_001427574.1 hypothetical protein (macronuclear) [Paramecium tetraurelia strain d4-2]
MKRIQYSRNKRMQTKIMAKPKYQSLIVLVFSEIMFLILSQEDHPLYERRFPLKKTTLVSQQVLNAQFILHAALDVFDEKYKSSKELFLKEIDQKQDYRVYGYVTPSNIRFLVLTDQDEERVKIFCQLAHEQLIKILMNPLYQLGTQITSPSFESVIQQLLQNKLNQ